ncbi:MAG: energy-coupling factor transporter transmembrane protein EcfT [Lachnospiraceae bacterium]|nr:energy-coupling factor transporter transmembrane protein EcfT [Lachnospiraceae bacterium]
MDTALSLPFEIKSAVKIDPRTKIFLTVTVSTIMVAGGTGGWMRFVRPSLAVFPVLALLAAGRWKAVLRFGITYAVLFTLELLALVHLTGAAGFLLGAVIGIYTHMLPGFLMGCYLIETTTVSEFVAAMERMHISQKIVIPVSVVFRFFPTVREEYAAIGDAMKMRGISSLRNPVKMLEYRIVPLMISVAKIGEELSAAALTRGLGAPQKRTNICAIGFGAVDVLLSAAAVFCWIGFCIG